ncbi:MAG: hypothetical protein ACON4U_02200 [Myxococcota bacterium]
MSRQMCNEPAFSGQFSDGPCQGSFVGLCRVIEVEGLIMDPVTFYYGNTYINQNQATAHCNMLGGSWVTLQ